MGMLPEDEWERHKGTGRTSTHFPDNKFHDSLTAAAKQSQLVRILEHRREQEAMARGFEDFTCQPRAKLPNDRPKTPPGQESNLWQRRSKQLEKPVMTRVLQALQDRLDR